MATCSSSSYFDTAVKVCVDKVIADNAVDNDGFIELEKLCETKECADYFREYKTQVQICEVALSRSETRGNDSYRDPGLCDKFLATMAPVTTVPATSAPTNTRPVTAVPATSVPTTSGPVSAPPQQVATPVVSTPPPTKAAMWAPTPTDDSSGATVVVIIVLALIASCIILFTCWWVGNKREKSTQNEQSTQDDDGKDTTAFSVFPSPRPTFDDSPGSLERPHKSKSRLNLPTDDGGKQKTDFFEFPSPRAAFDAAPASTASPALWTHSSITTNRIPLDKVHVGPCISHGGYGEVCIGTYKNAPVAIKRLLPMRRKDPESIASFLSEIQLTSSLDHACIVTFIGVAWDAPSDLCMVSEFISGGDMRSYLGGRASNSQGFDDDKLHIAVCVAHALTYLHSLQPVVVHRDLKSRNILLTQKPELHAKLMDFGVSCDRRDTTMTAGVGTSLWMAPEVMLGERYNEKADVFSFGVVLSELDTHELPYAQAKDPNSDRRLSEMVVMQRVVSGWLKPSFSDKADPEIVALADECLQLDPNLRPSAAVVLYRLHKNRFSGTLV